MSDNFKEDKLPEAKDSYYGMTLLYYFMALFVLFQLLLFTLFLVVVLCFIGMILQTKWQERQEADQTYNITQSLKQLASDTFGDN